MPQPLVTVTGLSLERGGRHLLDGLDLEIRAGDLLLVEGDNGAGKTTLLRSLAGLSRLGQTGQVKHACASLLYLGHRPGIKQLLTPRENLAWYCHSHGRDDAGVEAALAEVGLFGYEDMLCQHMSAGQQRRVNLARLYLSDAPLWLLDEPFTAIDRGGVRSLSERLVERVRGGGAVVLTSHQDLPLDYPLRKLRLGPGA